MAKKKTKAQLKQEEKDSFGNKIKLHLSIKYLGIRKHEVKDLTFNLVNAESEIPTYIRETYNDEKLKVDYIVVNTYDMHKQDRPLISCRMNIERCRQFRIRVTEQQIAANSEVDEA